MLFGEKVVPPVPDVIPAAKAFLTARLSVSEKVPLGAAVIVPFNIFSVKRTTISQNCKRVTDFVKSSPKREESTRPSFEAFVTPSRAQSDIFALTGFGVEKASTSIKRLTSLISLLARSEERRVGKEC